MRADPLASEVLHGLMRPGKAQLEHLGVALLQAIVLFLWWPKEGLAQMLETRHAPNTLMAVVITFGASTAYIALRAGVQELMLPGQHGLRAWALETRLPVARILRGYVLGQVVHSLHLLLFAAPLMLMALTISGGEWRALAWCLAAALVHAIFFRLCGAITHCTLGQHRSDCRSAVWSILFLVYVPLALAAPWTSHLALTARMLDDAVPVQPFFAVMPDHAAFLAFYAGASVLAAAIVYRLLVRARASALASQAPPAAGEAVAP